jgi:transcriptional regulator with XRE-family HTH domain
MDVKALGIKLKAARELNGLTQEDVVDRLGKRTIASISEYENGKRKISAVDLPDFARALNVPITYFFEDVLPEDELETALVEWFRMLPDEHSKRRIFTYIKTTAPLILGGDKDQDSKKKK